MGKNVQHIQVKTTGAKKSEKELNKVSSGLTKMAKQAGVAAAAYFGSQALLSAIKSSIDLFGKQEAAEKKLRFAAGGMTDALIAQSQALQKVTRFGDEQIIAQQAYLASLGLTQQQIEDTIEASVDLSAATGMTLESAVMNTSKTLSGMAGELGEKLGPAFRDLSIESLKAGDGIKFIAEQFGGTAQADAESFTGQIDQMNNAVGDAQESFGKLLAPAVETVAGFLKTGAENASNFISGLTETKLETTIRELEQFGVASESLLRLKNIQLDRDIAVLNDELLTMNENNLSNEQIEQRLLDISKEKKTLTEEITAINETDIEAKRLQQSEEIAFMEERFTRERELLEINNGTRQQFADLEQREREAREASRLELEENTGEAQLASIERLNDEELALAEISVKIAEINAQSAKRLNIEQKITKKTQEQIDAEKKLEKEAQNKIDLKKIEGKFEDALMGDIQKKMDIVTKGNIKDAHASAYKMANKAYESMAIIPVIGPALGVAAAVAAYAYGMKNVAGLKKAQYGADFVTDGPQMMMVGEGSGPERVQVTPLSDPNINGPQGQPITLNISGNVLHESFIEDNVIPQIREGLRLGENIGL